MPIQANGFIEDPDNNYIFSAVQYISPHEKWDPPGDGWINVRTESREITPGKGLLLWKCVGYNPENESEFFETYVKNLGHSRKFALQLQCSSFASAVKGGFFSGSNYKKIVAPFQKGNTDIDNILVLTKEQEQSFEKRAEILLPNLAQTGMDGDNVAYFDIDECFLDKTGFAYQYEGIALIHGIRNIHPALLWFNIGSGDCTIGNKDWTLLMNIANKSKVKDTLSSKGLKYLAEHGSALWNEYTLRKYLHDFQETIGKVVAECDVGSFLNMNHHIVILPDQIPDNWEYKGGKWMKKSYKNRNIDAVGYEAADIFFSF